MAESLQQPIQSADAISHERALRIPDLPRMKERGQRITMLTCYDALFARLLDASGVDMILVGDSVNEVLAGAETTLSATLEQMIYHTRMVCRGTHRAIVVCDLPFLSYQVSTEDALRNAGRVLKETGCQAVKLEGGAPMADTVRALVAAGIPVMGHLGFTPQSTHVMGGHRIQGRDAAGAQQLEEAAVALEHAGAFGIVLELVPAPLAESITKRLGVPTIGIGAGPGCDGQVLVLHDMLGLNETFSPRFLKRYAELAGAVRAAVAHYCEEVREGRFPDRAHSH
jgi:3-methyl-2-oxobutanoate hydroxymethyltransferase